jgi:predicted PurR-regulated permease PerM
MNELVKLPFSIKLSATLFSLFAIVFTLIIGKSIIIPLVYAVIIAILINPLVNFLRHKKINKIISIIIAVTFTIFIVLGLLFVIFSQIKMVSEIYPQLSLKFQESSVEVIDFISKKFKLEKSEVNTWIETQQAESLHDFSYGQRIMEISELMITLILLPIYLFMILYYKTFLIQFVRKLFGLKHQIAVGKVLEKTKKIIQGYLIGLFLEMLIVAIMNSIGLLIIGVKYAIVLGITGAILNLIPYIGGIIGIALPMIMAFVIEDSLMSMFLVLIVYSFIQLVDNNYIVPMVVASKVKINGLVSLIVVMIGGAIWGVSGMFLSIPITAILKVVFDHIDSLKPWGFLLGNTISNKSNKLLIPTNKF